MTVSQTVIVNVLKTYLQPHSSQQHTLCYSVYRLAYDRCLVWISPKSEWWLALTGAYLSHCLYLQEESQTSWDKGAWPTSCSPITDLKWSMPHFLSQGLADCLELSIAHLHNFSRKLILQSCAPSLSFLLISAYTPMTLLTHSFSSQFSDFTNLHLYNTPATQQYGYIWVYGFHLQNHIFTTFFFCWLK